MNKPIEIIAYLPLYDTKEVSIIIVKVNPNSPYEKSLGGLKGGIRRYHDYPTPTMLVDFFERDFKYPMWLEAKHLKVISKTYKTVRGDNIIGKYPITLRLRP